MVLHVATAASLETKTVVFSKIFLPVGHKICELNVVGVGVRGGTLSCV